MFNDVSLQRNNLVQNKISKKTEKDKQENTNTQALTTQQSVNKSDTLTANANELLAMQNLAFVSTTQKTQVSNKFENLYDDYAKNYAEIFMPDVEKFETLYNDSLDIACKIHNTSLDDTSTEFAKDFDYILKYGINEYLWEQYKTEQSQKTQSRSLADSEKSNEKTRTFTRKDGTIITITDKALATEDGYLTTDPNDFSSIAVMNIQDKNGDSYNIMLTTDDFTLENYNKSIELFQQAVLGLTDSAFENFKKEIWSVNLAGNDIGDIQGYHWSGANSITLTEHEFINSQILTHEIGHAIDNAKGDDNFFSQNTEEKFNKLKNLISEKLPDLAKSYCFENYNEWTACVYAQKNGGDVHMSQLLKDLNARSNSLTPEDKKEILNAFNDLNNQVAQNYQDISKLSMEERLGSDFQYSKDNLMLQLILQDKSILENYYNLMQTDIIPIQTDIKQFLRGFLKTDFEKIKGLMDEKLEVIKLMYDFMQVPSDNLEKMYNTFIKQLEDIVPVIKDVVKPQYIEKTENKTQNSINKDYVQNTVNNDFDNSNWQPTNTKQNNNINQENEFTSYNTGTNSSKPEIGESKTDFSNVSNSETPNIKNNKPNISGIPTTTENYSISGNINEQFGNNNFQIPENNKSLNNKSAQELFNDAVKAAENKAIENARQKYGYDTEIATNTKVVVDKDGNFKVEITVTAKGIGVANANGIGNISLSENSQSLSSLAQNTSSGKNEINRPTGWNSTGGQAIINNYSNGDGTLNTDAMINDWKNAGGEVYNYTGTAAQNAFAGLQNAATSGNYNDFYNNLNNYSSNDDMFAWFNEQFNVFEKGGGGSFNVGIGSDAPLYKDNNKDKAVLKKVDGK